MVQGIMELLFDAAYLILTFTVGVIVVGLVKHRREVRAASLPAAAEDTSEEA